MTADAYVRVPLRVREDVPIRLSVAPETPVTYRMGEYVEQRVRTVSDYEQLDNLPSIDGVTLVGDQTAEDIGIRPIGNAAILDLFR